MEWENKKSATGRGVWGGATRGKAKPSSGASCFQPCSSSVGAGGSLHPSSPPCQGEAQGAVFQKRPCPCGAHHLLAVYPQAAEPAIVFCCVSSGGKQVPATPDRFSKSPSLCATALGPAAALLWSQTTTTKDSSPPSICLGFNSLLAHLSWAIKHARDEPRGLTPLLYLVLQSREGEGSFTSRLLGEGDVLHGGMRPWLLPEESGSIGRAGGATASFCPCNATSCSGGGEEPGQALRSC